MSYALIRSLQQIQIKERFILCLSLPESFKAAVTELFITAYQVTVRTALFFLFLCETSASPQLYEAL